jgi:mannose-6-phosphate isomerase
MLYPLTFRPIFKERVWGGRRLEELYGKPLPSQSPFGESWEIADRPGDISIIANGPLAGQDLHWLVESSPQALLGPALPRTARFPLLIKILDAREKLSLQVHPPAAKAAQLGGEPKTEMWYIAEADPSAELFVGLRRGLTRSDFVAGISNGRVAECFHRVGVQAGDCMFLPSGRVHAIGAGLVIFEIQQNSDTTYRVYDWDRTGLDGKPRELHLKESLESMDFNDFEPALVGTLPERIGRCEVRRLVKDRLFSVERIETPERDDWELPAGEMQIIGLLTGAIGIDDPAVPVKLLPGQFCLLPSCLKRPSIRAEKASTFLRIEAGH